MWFVATDALNTRKLIVCRPFS